MRERLKERTRSREVDVQSTFYDGPNRSLVVEIPGRSRPQERIVMVAHVQEPGANDDGSGCGTLFALVVALHRAIESGRAPDTRAHADVHLGRRESRGSRQWLTSHPDQAKGVQYMFAMDMTGEDVSKTGGSFLIEKQPDPSAVWPRPSDPHTAWGASEVKADSLKGSLLNDLHLAICLRRARDSGWIVHTNPYEGGSDHTAFGEAGIPSLLNWHFTDRYYHTNLDRPGQDERRRRWSMSASRWRRARGSSRPPPIRTPSPLSICSRLPQNPASISKPTQNATPEILDGVAQMVSRGARVDPQTACWRSISRC